MLAERLGLKCHLENRTADVYALVLGKGPLKLARTAAPLPPYQVLDRRYYKQISTVGGFAVYLTRMMDREVVDLTRLEGSYAFNLDWTDQLEYGIDRSRPDASLLMKEVKSIGLALEPRKMPFQFLIVDHVDKEPTGN